MLEPLTASDDAVTPETSSSEDVPPDTSSRGLTFRGRPVSRGRAIFGIVAAGVLYIVVSLGSDRSVREAFHSSPATPSAPAVAARPPPRQIAPIRALAIAPATSSASAAPSAEPAPAHAEADLPKPHAHRRAKKKSSHKNH
jgi:hypothetical protein